VIAEEKGAHGLGEKKKNNKEEKEETHLLAGPWGSGSIRGGRKGTVGAKPRVGLEGELAAWQRARGIGEFRTSPRAAG